MSKDNITIIQYDNKEFFRRVSVDACKSKYGHADVCFDYCIYRKLRMKYVVELWKDRASPHSPYTNPMIRHY